MKKKQFTEALNRLRIIKEKYKILPYIQQQFKNDILVISESFGILYDIDAETLKEVRDFEDKYEATVYHIIRSFTEFGVLDSYLYVSKYEEEWGADNEDLQTGFPLVYVNNRDDEFCSEFGSIQFIGINGGLKRVQ